MSIISDLKLFFSYKRIIKKNRVRLQSDFNMRIDRADRIYTVLNIPTDLFEEPYNLRKEDIDSIAQRYIKDYISELSKFLNSIGLSELYDFYEPVKKVDKYSYLVVIGFRQLDSVDVNRIIYRIIIPTLLGISFLSFLIYMIF
jgi:hypothetical protein